MKTLSTISFLFILTACMFGQVPEKMSYQAVVRDAGGILVSNSNVGMQISILQGSAQGAAVYAETQTLASNDNGLVSLEIGDGTPITGTFDGIDWSNGPFFIKTETDPAGGTNYTISGTTQILSVPYALFAETAGHVDFTEVDPVYDGSAASHITTTDIDTWNDKVGTEVDPVFSASPASGITEDHISGWDNKLDMEVDGSVTNELQTISRSGSVVTLSDGGGSFTDSVNTYFAGEGIVINGLTISLEERHYVGELHLGGIIFFVDPSGQHGLIASLDDLDGGEGVPWSDVIDEAIGDAARSATNGAGNTDAIIAQQLTTSAAQLCRNLGTEWYLPSNREIYLLFTQEILIDMVLDNDGDDTTNGLNQEYDPPTTGRYWSSTEKDYNDAWGYKSSSGDTSDLPKTRTHRVRAIRVF